MERGQFTFYASFATAIARIKSKAARCDAYDAIVNYAIHGVEPDMDSLADSAAIAFDLIRPVLDKGAKKAESGKAGGSKQTASKPEANAKQTAREKEREKEGEREIEIEIDNPPIPPKGDSSFDRFWSAYPKKVGKEAARKAFAKAKAPLDVMLSAIDRQKNSQQWKRDNGQYIPNPATWLNQGRWDDEVQGQAPKVYRGEDFFDD